MKTTYRVLTQHDTHRGQFIVPIEVEAASPQEAAEVRFQMLSPGSRASTVALLVTRIDRGWGDAWVFEVTGCSMGWSDCPICPARNLRVAREPVHVGGAS